MPCNDAFDQVRRDSRGRRCWYPAGRRLRVLEPTPGQRAAGLRTRYADDFTGSHVAELVDVDRVGAPTSDYRSTRSLPFEPNRRSVS
jgi:hypothetical protein